jgi:hypothetical protein
MEIDRKELVVEGAEIQRPEGSIGWYCHEVKGVSIINAWLFVPEAIHKKVRKRNRWTQFLGFTLYPKLDLEKGKFIGFGVALTNPLKSLWYLHTDCIHERKEG